MKLNNIKKEIEAEFQEMVKEALENCRRTKEYAKYALGLDWTTKLQAHGVIKEIVTDDKIHEIRKALTNSKSYQLETYIHYEN